jgi:hypothetical protein
LSACPNERVIPREVVLASISWDFELYQAGLEMEGDDVDEYELYGMERDETEELMSFPQGRVVFEQLLLPIPVLSLWMEVMTSPLRTELPLVASSRVLALTCLIHRRFHLAARNRLLPARRQVPLLWNCLALQLRKVPSLDVVRRARCSRRGLSRRGHGEDGTARCRLR